MAVVIERQERSGVLLAAASSFIMTIVSRRWQQGVPTTNMREVSTAVGLPLTVSTNAGGIVRWDYTHWWSGTAKVYFDTNGNFTGFSQNGRLASFKQSSTGTQVLVLHLTSPSGCDCRRGGHFGELWLSASLISFSKAVSSVLVPG